MYGEPGVPECCIESLKNIQNLTVSSAECKETVTMKSHQLERLQEILNKLDKSTQKKSDEVKVAEGNLSAVTRQTYDLNENITKQQTKLMSYNKESEKLRQGFKQKMFHNSEFVRTGPKKI